MLSQCKQAQSKSSVKPRCRMWFRSGGGGHWRGSAQGGVWGVWGTDYRDSHALSESERGSLDTSPHLDIVPQTGSGVMSGSSIFDF
jgi:hypothetical protein